CLGLLLSLNSRLPMMPSFKTPRTPTAPAFPPADFCNLSARTSGQRQLASFVEPSPSVVDDPNATIDAPRDETRTSTPVRNGQEVIVVATGNFTIPVESPVSGET